MRMQYELGKYLKARYSDLLSASYERSEVSFDACGVFLLLCELLK